MYATKRERPTQRPCSCLSACPLRPPPPFSGVFGLTPILVVYNYEYLRVCARKWCNRVHSAPARPSLRRSQSLPCFVQLYDLLCNTRLHCYASSRAKCRAVYVQFVCRPHSLIPAPPSTDIVLLLLSHSPCSNFASLRNTAVYSLLLSYATAPQVLSFRLRVYTTKLRSTSMYTASRILS